MIVLDASVLIAYLDAEDAQHHRAESLLAREIDDQFAANPLTLAEVQQLVSELGFAADSVQITSDRHWTWSARKPRG